MSRVRRALSYLLRFLALLGHFDGRQGLSGRQLYLLSTCVLASATIRGADYIAINDCPAGATSVQRVLQDCAPATTSIVERAMPLTVWGIILIVGGVGAFVSWAARCWPWVILFQTGLSITFVALGVGQLLAVVGPNWIGSGWRSGVGLILVQGVLHFTLARAGVRQWDLKRARQIVAEESSS